MNRENSPASLRWFELLATSANMPVKVWRRSRAAVLQDRCLESRDYRSRLSGAPQHPSGSPVAWVSRVFTIVDLGRSASAGSARASSGTVTAVLESRAFHGCDRCSPSRLHGLPRCVLRHVAGARSRRRPTRRGRRSRLARRRSSRRHGTSLVWRAEAPTIAGDRPDDQRPRRTIDAANHSLSPTARAAIIDLLSGDTGN